MVQCRGVLSRGELMTPCAMRFLSILPFNSYYSLPANAGNTRYMSSIPGSGRSPGGKNGNPLQYSCLGNPMDRGACRAIVHGVAQSQTQLKQLSTHAQCYKIICLMDGEIEAESS